MNFPSFLAHELKRRQQVNPRYSLRAFAKYLDYDASSLSQIMRGLRPPSETAIRKFGKRLGVREAELEQWAQTESSRSKGRGELAIDEDSFRIVADWHHYAIFELSITKRFKSDPQWIAHQLRIPRSEAVAAINRLCRLGIFKRDAKGQLTRTVKYITTHHHPFSGIAFRAISDQLLMMGRNALNEIPYEEREQIGLTIAAREDDLPAIRQRMRRFHKQLNDWIEKRGKADRVYHLASTFYPVSRK